MHIFTSGRPSAAGDALMRMARATLAALAVFAIGAVSPVMAQTGDGDDPTNPTGSGNPTFANSVVFNVVSVLCERCDGEYDLVMINLEREEEGVGTGTYKTNFGSKMDEGDNRYLVFKEGDDNESPPRVNRINSVFIAPGSSDTEKANNHAYLQTGRLSPDDSLAGNAADKLLGNRVAWKIPDDMEFSSGYEMVLRLEQGHGYEGDDVIEMITLAGDAGDLKQTTITHIHLAEWNYDDQEAPLILTSYVDAGGNENLTGVDCSDTNSRYCDTALVLPTGVGLTVPAIGTRTDSIALSYSLSPDLTEEGPTAAFMALTNTDAAAGPTLRIDRTNTGLRDLESHVYTATWMVWHPAINAGDARRLRGATGTILNARDLYLTKEIRVVLDTDTPAVCQGDNSSTFAQLVRNRLVYAGELIGTNQTTLQYPSDTTKTPTYEIVARRTIGPGNAGDVTITLQGATFGEDVNVDDVRFVPSPGETNVVTDTSKITIAYKTGGLAGESEVVFNFGVSAHVGSGDVPANHRIRAGDRFVITLPQLTQVNLDQSPVTIGSSLVSTGVSGPNSFPDGLNAISKCVSDRQSSSARSCIYAKTVNLVTTLNLGTAPTRDGGVTAYIDNQDRTKFASRGPVTRMSFPPGFNNNGSTTTTHTNVLSMGAVTFNAGPIPRHPANACSDPFKEDINLQPLGKDGNPYRFRSDDRIVVTLEPNPTGANGLLLMKRIKDSNGNDPGTAVEIIPASANGFAEIDLGNPDNIIGEWEFFFMPGFNEMRYGETRSMMAEVRFGDGDYMNRSSSPASRTITLTVDGIGTKALAYALPPPQSPDESFIRIRCEQGAGNGGCQISLECYNHGGNSWFADVSSAIPSGGVTVMNRSDISSILAVDGFNPATDWGGDAGRLSCQVYTETDAEVSTQVLVRSGGSLTNNTFVDLGAN